MANYEVPQEPEFNSEIRKLETSDPANASLFNVINQQLFNNDLYLKKFAAENIASHVADKDNPHELTAASIGAATQAALDTAYANGNAYTDTQITSLINGAPNTLDTLKEIADAMSANETVVDALESAIGTKANQAELDTHTRNATTHITASERTKWNTVDNALSATSTNPIQNKAVKAVFDQQTSQNSNFANSITAINSNLSEVNQSLSDCDLITEGSGADTKYYIQKGADTASKKLLGRTPIEYRLTCTSGSSAFDGVAEITIPCEGYNKLTLRYKIDTINGTNGIAVKIDNATVLNIVLPNQEQTSIFSLIKSKNVFVKLIANYNAYCDISLS